MKSIQFIIPAYNEENNISKIIEAIESTLMADKYDFEFLFINDGSSDNTFNNLKETSNQNKRVKYIHFSRNFGKDNAIRAGISYANADCIITMDCDLQHPPSFLANMIEKWEEGYDVVYAFRENNEIHNNFFQNVGSKIFWKLMNYLSNLNLEQGTSDFRLLDKKVYNQLKAFNETEIFYRALVKWIGFKQIALAYKADKRLHGQTTYSKKMLFNLAISSITSFSTKPLYLSIYFGLAITAITFVFYAIYLIYSIYNQLNISGWASLISTVVFFGGINLTVLGVIGIYIGKLFVQSKNRPTYIISEKNF